MNNFFKIILSITICVFVISCNKNDSNGTEPLRDYTEQYNKDIANIETFLQTHYIEVVNHPGFSDHQDVTYIKIPTGGTQTPIWDMPNLVKNFTVDQNDIVYKVYYLNLNTGVGKSPCNYDSVLAAYNGKYLYTSVESVGGVDVEELKFEEFESFSNPQSFINLATTIRGWNEIFPNFKTGTYTSNPDGTISFNDFGAGIMFLPSGLAYYGGTSGSIPSYSPLIFNFKLYEISRNDQDGDGIDSYLEDLNNDGYVRILADGVVNPDDTDGDEIPNFLDRDDDADGYSTLLETTYTLPDTPTIKRYYPYNGATTDDLSTPQDETRGIPSCGTIPDYISTTRLRKHLDPTCH